MKAFADLLDRLSYSPSRNAKLRLMADYVRATPDPDRGWALAALTDGLPFSFPLRRTLMDMVARRMDPELFRLSRDYVGDTAETIALAWGPASSLSPSIADVAAHSLARGEGRGEGQTLALPFVAAPHPSPLPAGGEREPPRLADIVAELALIGRNDLGPRLETWLDALDPTGRWALLKLLTGALRVGVSARLAKTAVAEMAGFDVAEIEEVWHALSPPYEPLFAWIEGRGERPDVAKAPAFRPLMLSHALEEADWQALDVTDFSAEWKWDGIRVQVVARPGEAHLFSRTGDDIAASFPDVLGGFNFEAVLDGELLVLRGGEVAPFNDLQQRLNRKGVSKKQMEQFPAHMRLYDALLIEGENLRPLPWDQRRARLEAWHARDPSPAHRPLPAHRVLRQGGAAAAVGSDARERHRRHHAQAPRQRLRRGTAEGAVVEVEARAAHAGLRADVRAARLGQALVLLFRLHLRRLAGGRRRRGRAGAGGQGLFRLHRRGADWRSTAG